MELEEYLSWLQERARDKGIRRAQRLCAAMEYAKLNHMTVAQAAEMFGFNTDAGNTGLYRARILVGGATREQIKNVIDGTVHFDSVLWDVKGVRRKRVKPKPKPPPPPGPVITSQDRVVMMARGMIADLRAGDPVLACLQADGKQREDILRQLGELQWITEWLRDKLEKPPDDWNASSFRSIPDYVHSPAAHS